MILVASAAFSAAAGRRCNDFRNISASDQLMEMTVTSVVRDSTGFVWLGNGLGVDRFDGVRLRHYPIEGNDMKYRRVNALAAIAGALYAGNGDGLWRLDEGADSFRPALADTSRVRSIGIISSMLPTRDGNGLYLGTSTGLYRYTPATATAEAVPLVDLRLAAPSNHITGMDIAGDTLFLATEAGVIVMSDGSPVLYGRSGGFNSVVATPGRLFLGTSDSGVITFDRLNGEFAACSGPGSNVVTDLALDSHGILYVATDGAGIVAMNTSTGKIVDRFLHRPGQENGLSGNAVYTVYVDPQDLLWVGYYQLGASYTLYSSGVFSVYAVDGYSTYGRGVRVVKRHGPYTLLGTRDGAVVLEELPDGNVKVSHYTTPQLRSNMVISAAWYNGRFVIGTYGGGIHSIDPATGRVGDVNSDAEDYPFRRGHVFSLTAHPDGSMWCGTSAGVYRYSPGGSGEHWTSANSQLPEGNIYAIFFDSKGNGWICTENGLAVYDPTRGTISRSIFPKGFFNGHKFKEVYEDSHGRLYFLPEHGDIYYSNMAMTDFGPLATPAGLGREPRALIEDADGCLWLATSNGIFSRAADGQWMEYGSSDGVISPLFIDCTPIEDASGKLWFGNSRGLLGVQPHEVVEKRAVSEFALQLSDVLVNGERLDAVLHRDAGGDYSIDFPRHAGSITLQLTPLNYSDPKNVHYEYMLESDGDEWHDLSHSFDLSFYDLSGGTHRLRLRQAGRADTEVCVELHVPYPMWMWVCLLMTLVAVVSFFAYIRHARRLSAAQAAKPLLAAEAAASDAAGAAVPEERQRKYKTYSMRRDEGRRISEQLERIMKEDKPYTNPDLRLADLAEMAGVSAHKLSFYFSQHLKQSFYDYVNARRVDEFKRLAASPEAAKFTLTALSSKAGFSSRTSFFRYFKKVEGITPAEYMERAGR